MALVDDIMDEMKAEAAPSRDPLPWRSPDYKPTPEAIKAFQEDTSAVAQVHADPDPEDDNDTSQGTLI